MDNHKNLGAQPLRAAVLIGCVLSSVGGAACENEGSCKGSKCVPEHFECSEVSAAADSAVEYAVSSEELLALLGGTWRGTYLTAHGDEEEIELVVSTKPSDVRFGSYETAAGVSAGKAASCSYVKLPSDIQNIIGDGAAMMDLQMVEFEGAEFGSPPARSGNLVAAIVTSEGRMLAMFAADSTLWLSTDGIAPFEKVGAKVE